MAQESTESTGAETAEQQTPPKRRSRRVTRPAMAPTEAVAPEPAAEKRAADKPVVDVLAEFGKAPADKTAEKPVESAAELPKLDIAIPERKSAEEDREPAAEVRLPATALLFQAPDLSAARRSKTQRKSADAAPAEDKPAGEKKAPKAQKAQKAQKEQAESSEDTAGKESGSNDSGGQSAPEPGTRRRRRGGRGRRRPQTDNQQAEETTSEEVAEEVSAAQPEQAAETPEPEVDTDGGEEKSSSRRRRRRRTRPGGDDSKIDVVDEVTALKGSTRLEAKRQRRRDGRDAGRRRSIITEAEFLARRESVDRKMVVRELEGRTQIAVLEDDILVEHYVARKTQTSMVGNVYLGRVQNVLPSMEAAFVDLGRGRNAVLYAGEVNWDAAGLEGGQPRRIEQAMSSGDSVLVQVTKDPIGHKGARLTSQITLAGRYLVLVPSGAMTGISRKLPEPERQRLKKLLKDIVPEGQGVIVRTAAEGASEEELRRDVERLTKQWSEIEKKAAKPSTAAPSLLKGEPELATRVVRDIFNEDFKELIVAGDESHKTISEYLQTVAPDLVERIQHWTSAKDVFAEYRIDEQLAKGMDRKVWLPSGGSLVIDRTEAMTVVDVNTGKYTGSGGTLEETVTRNNLEAAEEIVRQLRLRDIGGIIVIDFIDMVLESNRDLVLRRLVECLGRDRTRHQVAEVTSLGLVQMTRKRVGQGLVEAFSHTCEHCNGRGFIVDNAGDDHSHFAPAAEEAAPARHNNRNSSRRSRAKAAVEEVVVDKSAPTGLDDDQREEVKATLAAIAAAAASAHESATDVAEPTKNESKTPAENSEAHADGGKVEKAHSDTEVTDAPAS